MCRFKKRSISTLPLISSKPSGYAVVGLEKGNYARGHILP